METKILTVKKKIVLCIVKKKKSLCSFSIYKNIFLFIIYTKRMSLKEQNLK